MLRCSSRMTEVMCTMTANQASISRVVAYRDRDAQQKMAMALACASRYIKAIAWLSSF